MTCASPIGHPANSWCACQHAIVIHSKAGECAACALLVAATAVGNAMAAAPRRRRLLRRNRGEVNPMGTVAMFGALGASAPEGPDPLD